VGDRLSPQRPDVCAQTLIESPVFPEGTPTSHPGASFSFQPLLWLFAWPFSHSDEPRRADARIRALRTIPDGNSRLRCHGISSRPSSRPARPWRSAPTRRTLMTPGQV